MDLSHTYLAVKVLLGYNFFFMFFHRTCDCFPVNECKQGQRCHRYDAGTEEICGNGDCKYLFGSTWGLVIHLLINSHFAIHN